MNYQDLNGKRIHENATDSVVAEVIFSQNVLDMFNLTDGGITHCLTLVSDGE